MIRLKSRLELNSILSLTSSMHMEDVTSRIVRNTLNVESNLYFSNKRQSAHSAPPGLCIASVALCTMPTF